MGDIIDFDLKKRLAAHPAYAIIPMTTLSDLERYINHHTKPGGFLEAVLRNDLKNAVVKADTANLTSLYPLVLFLSNQCPVDCWGSDEVYDNWLAKRIR